MFVYFRNYKEDEMWGFILIEGPEKDVIRFRETAKSERFLLDIEKIFPLPDDITEAEYTAEDYYVETGCGLLNDDIVVRYKELSNNKIIYFFETTLWPIHDFIIEVSKLYSTLIFTYYEEGCDEINTPAHYMDEKIKDGKEIPRTNEEMKNYWQLDEKFKEAML